MRIANLQLKFLNGTTTYQQGYTTPGWYLIATDAEVDDQQWAFDTLKITPVDANRIAQAISDVLASGNDSGVASAIRRGIYNQSVYARETAEAAAKYAENLAARAQTKAEELKEWDSVSNMFNVENHASDRVGEESR